MSGHTAAARALRVPPRMTGGPRDVAEGACCEVHGAPGLGGAWLRWTEAAASPDGPGAARASAGPAESGSLCRRLCVPCGGRVCVCFLLPMRRDRDSHEQVDSFPVVVPWAGRHWLVSPGCRGQAETCRQGELHQGVQLAADVVIEGLLERLVAGLFREAGA